MHYEDYSTLKAASKVAFKEIAATDSQRAYTVLERKSYNPNTGAESTVEDRLNLADLEREKDQLTAEKSRVQAKLTEVGKMITDIKAL